MDNHTGDDKLNRITTLTLDALDYNMDVFMPYFLATELKFVSSEQLSLLCEKFTSVFLCFWEHHRICFGG